jgi:hypothetical protein
MVLLAAMLLPLLLAACTERKLARLAADWCRNAGTACDYHGEGEVAR